MRNDVNFLASLNALGSICSIVALLMVVQVKLDIPMAINLIVGASGGLCCGAILFRIATILYKKHLMDKVWNFWGLKGIYWLVSFLFLVFLTLFCGYVFYQASWMIEELIYSILGLNIIK